MKYLKGTVSGVAVAVALASPSGTLFAMEPAVANGASQDNSVSAAVPVTETGREPVRRDINPYDRDIALTVPLQFNQRVLGELPVLLTRDDRFVVESESFIRLLSPLLTPDAQASLRVSLDGFERFEPTAINQTGIRLEYDPDQLAVVVLRIDPSHRVPEFLFTGGFGDAPEDAPESFSAYLNTNLSLQHRSSTGDVDKPGVSLNGAINYRGVVFEADFQGRHDRFEDAYEFERRYARFIYDQPGDYRRWFLGDLSPETRGRQGFVEMGGLGVARQTRRFNAFRNNVLTSARQFTLQESAVVRVLKNGIFVREFRLDPGQYDVSNLPLNTGNNDIELEIEGQSGFRDRINYSAYLDTIDLEPGDYEYGAYVGVLADRGFGPPSYDNGKVAFTGYYRKAFLDRPAIGVGFQAMDEVQNFSAQTQYLLTGGSRLRLDGSVSNSKLVGSGYAFAASYDFILDNGGQADVWTVVADYTSEDYSELGRPDGGNVTSWTASAGYTKRFSPDWTVSLSGSYRMSRSERTDDSYAVNLVSSYRVTPQWTAQMGLEYVEQGYRNGSNAFSGDGVGVTLALVWTPRYDRRVEARYASARDSASVRFQQAPRNLVDGFGYSLTATDDPEVKTLSGQIDYVANRFDASLSHFAVGNDFANVTNDQSTSFRIGSAIAFAGGKVAIGRSIYDSFAIVYPHHSLKGGVIAGESLEGGRYTSRSGALGPALDNTLTAYVNQSVHYDAIRAPVGYDIGEGIRRVHPTYRSGYTIEVGSSKFVSALGRLVGNGEKPASLLSGRLRPVEDPTAEPEIFFTNSVGRFAIQSLEPGKSYRVELFSNPPIQFEFTVPEDSDGLLDLNVVRLPLEIVE